MPSERSALVGSIASELIIRRVSVFISGLEGQGLGSLGLYILRSSAFPCDILCHNGESNKSSWARSFTDGIVYIVMEPNVKRREEGGKEIATPARLLAWRKWRCKMTGDSNAQLAKQQKRRDLHDRIHSSRQQHM